MGFPEVYPACELINSRTGVAFGGVGIVDSSEDSWSRRTIHFTAPTGSAKPTIFQLRMTPTSWMVDRILTPPLCAYNYQPN